MNVAIYTTPACPYCKKAKTFFDENDIDYSEYNVAEDTDKAREMIQKSGQKGVPVTVITNDDSEEVIVGFNKDKLSDALGLNA